MRLEVMARGTEARYVASLISEEDSCASIRADAAASCAPQIIGEDAGASTSAGAASCASRIIDEDSCASMSWHTYPRLRIGNPRRGFLGFSRGCNILKRGFDVSLI